MPNESKMKEDEDYSLPKLPEIDITRVEISPNPADLNVELNLEVDFTLDTTVEEGHWEIKVSSIRCLFDRWIRYRDVLTKNSIWLIL